METVLLVNAWEFTSDPLFKSVDRQLLTDMEYKCPVLWPPGRVKLVVHSCSRAPHGIRQRLD